jgi:hypothetical protein
MAELFGILLWIGCLLGCYYIAIQKNRNVWGWVAGAFFTGVIALIILAILPTKETV